MEKELTKKARNFIEANQRSPVVSATVIGNGGRGARYTLQNGKAFVLTRNECEVVGTPRWFDPTPA